MSTDDINDHEVKQRAIAQKKKQTSGFFKSMTISWGLIKLRGLIFNKIFTNYLDQNEFGRFNFLIQTATFLGSFGTSGLSGAIFRFTSVYTEEKNRRKISNLIITSLILATGFYIIITGVYLVLVSMEFFSFKNFNTIVVVLVGSFGFFYLLQNLSNAYIQAQRRFLSYVIVNVAVVYSNLIIAVLFVFFSEPGANELVLSYVLSHGFFISIYFLKIIFDNGLGSFSKEELTNVVKYSAPTLIISPFYNLFNYLQYFLLTFFAGEQAVALFVICLSVIGFLNIIVNPISSAFSSLQYSLFDSNEHDYLKSLINKMTRVYMALLVPIIVLFWYNAPFLIEILSNSEFVNSETVLGTLILGFSFLFKALLHFTCQGPYFFKKTPEISLLYLRAVIIAGISSLIIVPIFGLLGMCTSFLLHDFFRWFFVFPFSQKVFRIKYSLVRILSIGIPTMFFLTVSLVSEIIFGLPSLLASICGLLSYLIILFSLKITGVNETKQLMRQLLKR
ncbi:MAG: oligosaccharide flippase family protein [Candidatus Heimdallarchaeota archaeon]|nr:MAG: oligosaccharide flippase family protein [Candidatus Heimdallarchaeota archaeon]